MKNNQYIRQAQYKKGFANLVLVGTVVILIAIGGYFTWSKKSNNTNTPESLLPEASQADTSNWKTYRNDKYGIEFKHPTGWYIYDGVNGGSGIAIYERRVGPGLPGVTRLMNIY